MMIKTAPEHIAYLKELVGRGGPAEGEWPSTKAWMFELGGTIEKKLFSEDEIKQIYAEIGNSFPVETIQGHTFHKPRKYAGDFELLDKIQTEYITGDKHYANWDRYFHSCEAPRAVRYRIVYLNEVLRSMMGKSVEDFTFLNIASGPCRDIYSFLSNFPDSEIGIECVEHDADAIKFSKELLKEHINKVIFHNTNLFRFNFQKNYDLIWSAGLFDYFDDVVFVRKLRKMFEHLNSGGKIVIGNLADTNPSKYYMLLFKWIVNHRSAEKLYALTKEAEIDDRFVYVDKEPLGVNVFLHINKP